MPGQRGEAGVTEWASGSGAGGCRRWGSRWCQGGCLAWSGAVPVVGSGAGRDWIEQAGFGRAGGRVGEAAREGLGEASEGQRALPADAGSAGARPPGREAAWARGRPARVSRRGTGRREGGWREPGQREGGRREASESAAGESTGGESTGGERQAGERAGGERAGGRWVCGARRWAGACVGWGPCGEEQGGRERKSRGSRREPRLGVRVGVWVVSGTGDRLEAAASVPCPRAGASSR